VQRYHSDTNLRNNHLAVFSHVQCSTHPHKVNASILKLVLVCATSDLYYTLNLYLIHMSVQPSTLMVNVSNTSTTVRDDGARLPMPLGRQMRTCPVSIEQ
jgi:hypothetical protein